MSDHVAFNAVGLTAMEEVEKLGFFTKEGTSTSKEWQKQKFSFSESEEEKGEKKACCRICHEDDLVKNLEAPCTCNGSLKMAHRACIQKWCNSKRSTICEICKQPYRDGYTLSQSIFQTILDVNDNDDWDEEAFYRNRLFPVLEPHRIFGIDPYDGVTNGDRFKGVIVLAILLISLDLLMMWTAFSVLVEQIGIKLSTFCLVFFGLFMLIYTLTWMRSLSGPRRRRLETAGAPTVLNVVPVGMPIPESMHRRRVVQQESESDDEDKDSE